MLAPSPVDGDSFFRYSIMIKNFKPKSLGLRRASVLPFQKCVNSVSGFANSVFYRFRFAKFCFLPFQIFKIPFHFFQAVFLLSIIFVFKIVSVSAF